MDNALEPLEVEGPRAPTLAASASTALESFAEDARQFNIVSRRGHVSCNRAHELTWKLGMGYSTHFKPRLIDSLCLGDNLATWLGSQRLYNR